MTDPIRFDASGRVDYATAQEAQLALVLDALGDGDGVPTRQDAIRFSAPDGLTWEDLDRHSQERRKDWLRREAPWAHAAWEAQPDFKSSPRLMKTWRFWLAAQLKAGREVKVIPAWIPNARGGFVFSLKFEPAFSDHPKSLKTATEVILPGSLTDPFFCMDQAIDAAKKYGRTVITVDGPSGMFSEEFPLKSGQERGWGYVPANPSDTALAKRVDDVLDYWGLLPTAERPLAPKFVIVGFSHGARQWDAWIRHARIPESYAGYIDYAGGWAIQTKSALWSKPSLATALKTFTSFSPGAVFGPSAFFLEQSLKDTDDPLAVEKARTHLTGASLYISGWYFFDLHRFLADERSFPGVRTPITAIGAPLDDYYVDMEAGLGRLAKRYPDADLKVLPLQKDTRIGGVLKDFGRSRGASSDLSHAVEGEEIGHLLSYEPKAWQALEAAVKDMEERDPHTALRPEADPIPPVWDDADALSRFNGHILFTVAASTDPLWSDGQAFYEQMQGAALSAQVFPYVPGFDWVGGMLLGLRVNGKAEFAGHVFSGFKVYALGGYLTLDEKRDLGLGGTLQWPKPLASDPHRITMEFFARDPDFFERKEEWLPKFKLLGLGVNFSL